MDGSNTGGDHIPAHTGPEASPVVSAFGQGAAADLHRLADFHDREPAADFLEGLRGQPLQDFFAVTLDRDDAHQGFALMEEFLGAMSQPVDQETLDTLAADFAAIYLNHTYRAAPLESVWVHDEPLVRQEAMFAVRRWYSAANVVQAPGDNRDSDHLVLELHFLALLLERARDEEGLRHALRFLDAHPMRWVPAFCSRVAGRCATAYYGGLALLTGAYLDRLRDLLGAFLDVPRPSYAKEAAVPDTRPTGCG